MSARTMCRLGVVALVTLAPPVAAQGARPISHADSVAAMRGAVRAALQPKPGVASACVVAIVDRFGTAAGRQFVRDGLAAARTAGAPSDSAPRETIAVVSVTGHDTVRVLLGISGDEGPGSQTSWLRRIAYDFVRGFAPGSWTLLRETPVYLADYIVTSTGSGARSRCLNARR